LLTYVAAFRSVAARARPLHHAACISRRANTILIAQGAELLGRYDSDARTTGVVPRDNCQGHRPHPLLAPAPSHRHNYQPVLGADLKYSFDGGKTAPTF
jgi:hypothetical protein